MSAGSLDERGAMTVQALRVELGRRRLRPEAARLGRSLELLNAMVGDITVLASAYSGVGLAHFFDDWLCQPAKPTAW